MTLFSKLGEAISANLNSAIENNTNPSVMADYYEGKASDELDKTRKEVAEVMADRKAAEREVEAIKKNIADMDKYAEKAMQAGNRDDAREFLVKKNELEQKLSIKETELGTAQSNEKDIRGLYEQQKTDYEEIVSAKSGVKANVAKANIQGRINEYGSSSTSKTKAMFKKMQDKSVRMVDVADAEAEINNAEKTTENLVRKYDAKNVDIDAQLEALATRLGVEA
jgi:phage shock protein A